MHSTKWQHFALSLLYQIAAFATLFKSILLYVELIDYFGEKDS